MLQALARRYPLHVAVAEAGGGAQRIGVIDEALADDGHGFKATVWVRRKTGHGATVVHAPTIFDGEVITQVPAGQGGGGAHFIVAFGISVGVVDAKKERIAGLPGKTQWLYANDW